MFRNIFLDRLRMKAEEFEPEFIRLLEVRNSWQSEKPAETGFYYVRQVASPEVVSLRYYYINEGYPYERNTVMNRIVPPGELEFLGPFGVEVFVSLMAVEDLNNIRGSYSYPTCKSCGLPPGVCNCWPPDRFVEPRETVWDPEDAVKEVEAIRCKVCDVLIYPDELCCTDGKAYWHRDCDGEGGSDV
nr:hypothetical protein [Maridesulfovibrio sp.]